MTLFKRINKQKRSLLCSLLLGKYLKVINSTDPNKIGLEGTILLEKREFFIILTPKNNKVIVPKKECIFEIDGLKIEGSLLMNELWERIKKYW